MFKSTVLKSLNYLALGCSCITLLACSHKPQFTLQQVWKTAGFLVPESVLLVGEGAQQRIFVSQIDGQGGDADGKGAIAEINSDGALIDANWISGLNAPKGMAAFNNRLYVADLTELVIIDIAQKQIIQKLPLPQAKFANDVAVDKNGVVYISDTMAHRVYKFADGNASVLVKDTDNANGLWVTDSGLMINCAEELKFYDFQQQKLTTLESGFSKNLDGIAALDDKHFLLSVWAGKIYEYTLGGGKAVLLDSTEQKINTADIALDQKSRVLYVPNFLNNTVTAYKVLP
ncbi:MAG TPA: GTP-binding protein [Cellvibrionaceae bacterium]|nr:GTP-binding protein [Cellvibrionaceae bacterium]